MPFKANASRRHHIPKQRHWVRNWAAYDAGLRARGSLTVWLTQEAVERWQAGTIQPHLDLRNKPQTSPVYVCVEDGTLTMEVEGKESRQITAGQAIAEPLDSPMRVLNKS